MIKNGGKMLIKKLRLSSSPSSTHIKNKAFIIISAGFIDRRELIQILFYSRKTRELEINRDFFSLNLLTAEASTKKMKTLTVLLISLAALACSLVTADPIQISNNNIGEITSVKIDINGKITSVVNQVSFKSVEDKIAHGKL